MKIGPLPLLLLIYLLSTFHPIHGQDTGYVMTVNGRIAAAEMGKTLVHEHIVTNFSGTHGPNESFENPQKAIDIILPHLDHIKSLGYKTIFECTPSYIGKNVSLLQTLSKLSGLNIITNTGYYAAVDKKYLPENIDEETPKSLAALWYEEWKKGISSTGIRPGFIKLGVGNGKLDSIEQKIFSAGLLLSSKTGMAIAVHTGDGTSIKSQYSLALEKNFNLDKLIWVHAQNGKDDERIAMAEKGIWISLDGVSETRIEEYVAMIVTLRDHSLLSKLLLSHDDGWSVAYNDRQPELTLFGNGNSKPYRTISETLLIRLYNVGFTNQEIDLIFVDNPKKAFAILD